jgi:hypothetical protein
VKDVVDDLPSTSLDFHREVKHVKTASEVFCDYWDEHDLDVACGMVVASMEATPAIQA